MLYIFSQVTPLILSLSLAVAAPSLSFVSCLLRHRCSTTPLYFSLYYNLGASGSICICICISCITPHSMFYNLGASESICDDIFYFSPILSVLLCRPLLFSPFFKKFLARFNSDFFFHTSIVLCTGFTFTEATSYLPCHAMKASTIHFVNKTMYSSLFYTCQSYTYLGL